MLYFALCKAYYSRHGQEQDSLKTLHNAPETLYLRYVKVVHIEALHEGLGLQWDLPLVVTCTSQSAQGLSPEIAATTNNTLDWPVYSGHIYNKDKYRWSRGDHYKHVPLTRLVPLSLLNKL